MGFLNLRANDLAGEQEQKAPSLSGKGDLSSGLYPDPLLAPLLQSKEINQYTFL